MTLWQRVRQKFGYPVEHMYGARLLRSARHGRIGHQNVLLFNRAFSSDEQAALKAEWEMRYTGAPSPAQREQH